MSDTAHPVSDVMHRIWISAILFGALAVILGVVILVWPGPSIVVAAVLFGVYLVMSGVAMVILAFALPAASGASRFLYFISGAVSVILGILAFRHFGEGYAILLLAIWIAVGFIFRGVSVVALAISYPRFPGRGWSIFFGIISMLAGVVVLAYPFDSIVTLALVVGIWLIILGVMEVISAFGMRSDVKKVKNITGTADRPAVA
jgi:uncharacterized membrane protein HdeD (DUF308 family)